VSVGAHAGAIGEAAFVMKQGVVYKQHHQPLR